MQPPGIYMETYLRDAPLLSRLKLYTSLSTLNLITYPCKWYMIIKHALSEKPRMAKGSVLNSI